MTRCPECASAMLNDDGGTTGQIWCRYCERGEQLAHEDIKQRFNELRKIANEKSLLQRIDDLEDRVR